MIPKLIHQISSADLKAAWRGITGSLLIASNFFGISTCSYLRPMPGVLWPVMASEIALAHRGQVALISGSGETNGSVRGSDL